MAKVDVVSWTKSKVGQVDLAPEVFEVEVREDILHTVVNWQRARRRSGTHKTKTRSEVRGGGAKPYKQKGTGNARRGSQRSPLIVGGAVLFGPVPRDYDYQLPIKVRQAGLRSALSYLNKNGRLHIVDGMDSQEGKTKELHARLGKFGLEKGVLVSGAKNEKFGRAAKNLAKYVYYPVQGLNVYDLLKYDNAVITQDALSAIVARCGVGGSDKAPKKAKAAKATKEAVK